jgi:hypothetical protein
LVPATYHPVVISRTDTATDGTFPKADEGTRTLDLLHGKQTL